MTMFNSKVVHFGKSALILLSILVFCILITSVSWNSSSGRPQVEQFKQAASESQELYQTNLSSPRQNRSDSSLRVNQDQYNELYEQYIDLISAYQELNSTCSPSRSSTGLVTKELCDKFTEKSVQKKGYLTTDDIPDQRVSAISCTKLFQNVPKEKEVAREFHRLVPRKRIPDAEFIDLAQNCDRYVADRRYATVPASEEEENFPLAFSILIFKDIEQFERLLRAIYRPQNHYCIHVDKKSDKIIHDATNAICQCFPNVFVASRWFDVQWGTFSVVEPELVCMEELLKRSGKWKYFINLTGQEFPLKTNWEIVRILKVFNGSNNLEGTVARRNTDRVEKDKRGPPVDVTLTKGSVHITASRAFVQYVVYDKSSLLFRDWVKDTYVSDETYFSSLNHSPQLAVPGSYLGVPETDTRKNLFITRFKNWGDGPFNWPCGGQRVRQVCIFGIDDLPLLSTRPELFANKFYNDFEPLTLDCMEELHNSRVRSELGGVSRLNIGFYQDLDFVKNHL